MVNALEGGGPLNELRRNATASPSDGPLSRGLVEDVVSPACLATLCDRLVSEKWQVVGTLPAGLK